MRPVKLFKGEKMLYSTGEKVIAQPPSGTSEAIYDKDPPFATSLYGKWAFEMSWVSFRCIYTVKKNVINDIITGGRPIIAAYDVICLA